MGCVGRFELNSKVYFTIIFIYRLLVNFIKLTCACDRWHVVESVAYRVAAPGGLCAAVPQSGAWRGELLHEKER